MKSTPIIDNIHASPRDRPVKPSTSGTESRPGPIKAPTLIDLSGYKIVSYRVSLVREPQGSSPFEEYRETPLRSAEDVRNFAMKLFPALGLDEDREHLVLFCLNNKNRLCGLTVVSTGSLTQALVHPREVFHAAIVLRAAAIIVAHNHPSGNPNPSPEDIDITKRLKEVADVMGIRFLDHVVLGRDTFFSFSDRHML